MAYQVLDWLCVVSAVLAPLPALCGTIRAWWTGELGAGARRPEPTIATLLCNACWCLFGITEHQLEPFGINAVGGVVQTLGFVIFLRLCTPDARTEALAIPFMLAVLYFVMTLAVGTAYIQVVVYQCLCTFPGLLAASAPLLTFFFLMDGPAAELLPPHWVLFGYMVHGFVWCMRAWRMHPRNYYMLSQNALGAFSSFLQLIMVLRPAPMIEQDPHGLQAGLLAVAQEEVPIPVPQAPLYIAPPVIPAPGNITPALPAPANIAPGELPLPGPLPAPANNAQAEMPLAAPANNAPAEMPLAAPANNAPAEIQAPVAVDDEPDVIQPAAPQAPVPPPDTPRRSPRIAAMAAAAANN